MRTPSVLAAEPTPSAAPTRRAFMRAPSRRSFTPPLPPQHCSLAAADGQRHAVLHGLARIAQQALGAAVGGIDVGLCKRCQASCDKPFRDAR